MVKGNSPEMAAIRDKVFALQDYIINLNFNTPEEAKASILSYLGKSEGKQVKLVTLTDFVTEYMRLKSKTYSHHSIRKYDGLLKNITHFRKHSGLIDSFQQMPEDKQTVFFSSFVDFLLFEEIFVGEKKVKGLYENGTVKEQFKLIKAVVNKFNSTGVKVDLAEFSDFLKEGNTQGTFCGIEELAAIYNFRKAAQGLPLPEQKAADLFLFQAFTGFRYNELKFVTQNSISIKIINGHSFKSLNNIADKEGLVNSVPLSQVCQEVITRWAGKTKRDLLLPVLSEFQYNSNLHAFLARIEMMHRIEKRVRYRGNDRVEEEVTRYNAITSHAGRHTYSHLLLKSGLKIEEVSHLMNHASSETTDKNYKHLLEDQLEYRALGILNKAI
jgi:integrase